MTWSDCGVRPMWPTTGTSASVRRRTSSARAAAAFDLDGLRAGFLEEADGVVDCVVDSSVVRAVGHVGDEEGAACCAGDGASVVEHLVEGDGKGIVVSKDDHGERVADEDKVDAGLVGQAGGGIVVGGERDDRAAETLLFEEGLCGDARGGGTSRLSGAKLGEAHCSVLQCHSGRGAPDAARYWG